MRVFRGLVACLLFILAGCSSSKTVSPHDVAVEIQQAASLASESRLFVEIRLAGRTTKSYDHEHAKYLEDKADNLLKELNSKMPPADLSATYEQLRSTANSISLELQTLHTSDQATLRATVNRFDEQQRTLQALGEPLQ